MEFPEISRAFRRSWNEIHEYYASGLAQGISRFRLLLDFSTRAKANLRFGQLVTVGRLACILVYRDGDCLSEKGWFLIGEADDKICVGYFLADDFEPNELVHFTDANTAMDYFETTLVANGFVSDSPNV